MKKLSILSLLCVSLSFSSLISEKQTTEIPANISDETFDETIFNWSRTFAQAMDIAHKKHYAITDPKENMIKAIDGFINSLDAHSNFLDPKTYHEMLEMTSGEFFGVGIVIDNMRKTKDKHLTIVDTIPDGPADKVGIQPMDKIVEIDGEILEGLSTEKIVSKLKGERHSTVKVKIMRENSPDLLPFDIVRDVVKEQHSLSFHIKSHNIAYISLSMFTDTATKQIETLLKKSQEQHAKGLILDLRNNSGGLLNAAIDIAGLFLKKGSLVALTKDKYGKEIERYATRRNPVAKNNLPIFILINNYTASAGEILAGCLKINSDTTNDYLAFLVGTKTFGKGSVQEVIPISNNCALKITTCLYFLPDNTTIQGTGIEPDFMIERTTPPTEQIQWFTKNYGREETLDNYIKVTKDGVPLMKEKKDPSSHKAPSGKFKNNDNRRYDRAKEMLQNDNQLRDCISLISMLNTAQKYTPKLVTSRGSALTYLKQNYISGDKLEIEEVKL
ncbi:MAG TPA: S41 family peptidase [Candidatus Babeliales bacterium]|jgi:carboxyl-terminal processing protease|nr:S41 family peptidase [Candidatus Babeliales bacterium]